MNVEDLAFPTVLQEGGFFWSHLLEPQPDAYTYFCVSYAKTPSKSRTCLLHIVVSVLVYKYLYINYGIDLAALAEAKITEIFDKIGVLFLFLIKDRGG